MIHQNEYDMCFQASRILNPSKRARRTKEEFNFDFHLPDNRSFVYGFSFKTQHPEGMRARLNGRPFNLPTGQITAVNLRDLRPGGKNTFSVELPGGPVRFYGNLTIQVQFDRVNPTLPLGGPWFKAVDLTHDIAFSDFEPIRGCSFFRFPERRVIESDGIPFITLPSKLICDHAAFDIGVRAEKIYFLGMISTWDLGTVHIQTRLGDARCEQFIGDHLGTVIVEYADGHADRIPLIYGVTLWWDRCWFLEVGGKPCQEPFLSNPRSRRTLEDTLLLRPAVPGSPSAFYLTFHPRAQVIRRIHLETTGLRAGHPVLSGITLETGEETEIIRRIPVLFRTRRREIRTVDGAYFKEKRFQAGLHQLMREVYTFKDSLSGPVPLDIPKDHAEPHTVFTGGNLATVLTNEYYHNVFAAKKLLQQDGSFNVGLNTFGIFPGEEAIGTWAERDRIFPKSHGFDFKYARDLGSTHMELAGLGLMDRCCKSARVANRQLYEVKPPHWVENGWIFNHRKALTFTALTGRKFSGLIESNGHNWVVLSYYALFHHTPDRVAWRKDFWKPFADAVEWNCWLMDNPVLPDQPKDIIPEGGEYAGENNMIRYEAKVILANQDVGKMPPFRADCACANFFAYYALLAGIRLACALGMETKAKRWRHYAGRLYRAILRHLVVNSPSGPIWHISMDSLEENLYLTSRLSPLYLWSDTFSFRLDDMDSRIRAISRNSYREHRRRWPGYCHCIHEVGYGTIYSALGAMMLDEVEDYTQYAEDVATHTYFRPRGALDDNGKVRMETFPYVVHMRRGVHESGRFWKVLGIAANVIHVTALLKMVRLIRGLDDWDPWHLRVMPRLPRFVKTVTVREHPVIHVRGNQRVQAELDMTYTCAGKAGQLELRASETIPAISVRLGPFPPDTKQVRVVFGKRKLIVRPSKSGDSAWAWVRKIPNADRIQLTFQAGNGGIRTSPRM